MYITDLARFEYEDFYTENLQDSAVAAFEAANDEKNMSTALENGGQKVDTEVLVDTVNSIYSADYR